MRRNHKKTSGFKIWNQYNHAEDYLIYPENIGENLGIDEVSLSKGELLHLWICKYKRKPQKLYFIFFILNKKSIIFLLQ